MSEPTVPAAAEPAVSQDALSAMSPDARAKWEMDGVWPAPGETTTTDPDADEHDEPEPAPAGDPPPPAPEPDKVAAPAVPERTVSKRQQRINELERKAAESDRRAADLATKLAAIEARTPAAEPPKVEAPAPIVDPADPEPQETDFDDYRQFTIAVSKWAYRQEKREESAAAERAAADKRQADDKAEFETKMATWGTKVNGFIAKHPDRGAALDAFLARVYASTPIGDTLMESEVGVELADYFAGNLAEAERIARLAPISALRELGKLEARFSPTHASARAQPAAKTVTTAPAPPTTLAARTADPADPVAAAVARGDYSTFERAENERAVAAR